MKLAKKCLAVVLVAALVFSLAGVATANNYIGSCGTNTKWELTGTGVLTIEGTGAMKAYSPNSKSDFRQYDSKIKTVVIKAGVSGIGAHAFRNMPVLTTVKLNGGSNINQYAFADCPVLSSVTFGSGVLLIGPYAFSQCPSLTNLVLSDSVSTIQNHAFAGCTGLQSIEIQNKNCRFLSSDILPQGVTVIGYKGSTAEEYAEKNGLAFRVIGGASPEQPTQPATQPTSGTTPTTDAGKCPLCGQTHEGFPGSLIGGLHSFIYGLLMLFGMRK